eukprot:2548974-Amphidinium_carterae.1
MSDKSPAVALVTGFRARVAAFCRAVTQLDNAPLVCSVIAAHAMHRTAFAAALVQDRHAVHDSDDAEASGSVPEALSTVVVAFSLKHSLHSKCEASPMLCVQGSLMSLSGGHGKTTTLKEQVANGRVLLVHLLFQTTAVFNKRVPY